jgi:hypothetical protein
LLSCNMGKCGSKESGSNNKIIIINNFVITHYDNTYLKYIKDHNTVL